LSTEEAKPFVVMGGVLGLDREVLQQLLEAVIKRGMSFRFAARGHSMHPFIRDRDVVTVAPLPERPLRQGEIVAFRQPESGNLILHRIREVRGGRLLVQGDNLPQPDGEVGDNDVLGLVTRAEREGVRVYRGEEPPGIGDRLAWASRLALERLVRHLAALVKERMGPVVTPATDQPGYADRQPLFDLPLLSPTVKRTPRGLTLELTARCNCDCRHCSVALPASDPAARAAELTLAEIDRIAGEAAELGALWCLLTGGEPLLRADFSDVYLALKRRGLLVSVFTNATLLTPEHVRLFQRYPPRDIEITAYGATPATYERVTRRPGSFAAFRRGLDLLLDGGVKVRLKAMALRSNVHELPEIARFCRERTKDFFRFDPLLTLRHDGAQARNQTIREERLSAAEIVDIERADDERSRALQKECGGLIASGCEGATCGHLFHCGAGTSSFTVAADGRFRLCTSLGHPDTTFDLRQGSVRQAWEELVPRVRDMRSRRPDFLEKCHSCPLVNLCLWCPAHAHLETGEMDACPEYFCAVAHARAKAIGPKAR
jgi:radical SAM protein with 4Fe4S-binding SPASM domain